MAEMSRTPEVFNSAIVVVGEFNPAIFSPDWLERHHLIGESDAKSIRESAADQLIVSHQISTFTCKWFSLQVIEKQFSLTSKDALSPAFKDLAAGIFQLLQHCPVSAIGMNFTAHYKMKDESEFHKVGDILAPKEIWNQLYPGKLSGLNELSVLIQDGVRGEPLKSKNAKRIAVRASDQVKFGITITYNDHHDFSDHSDANPGERVSDLLDKDWQAAWDDALSAFDGLLAKALQ